jgi:undecaprenyl pyrophosphate synthase
MKKVPAHVAIVLDAFAAPFTEGSAGGDEAEASAARAVAHFAEQSGVRFVTLCLKEAEKAAWPRGLHSARDAERRTRRLSRLRIELGPSAKDAGAQPAVQILSQSGRADIVLSIRKLAAEVAAGRLRADEVDTRRLGQELSSAAFPDPDLIILCGRKASPKKASSADAKSGLAAQSAAGWRLSECLLYEGAYAEFHFCEATWKDFAADPAHFRRALSDYGLRERRFGLTSAQLVEPFEQEAGFFQI